MYCRSRNTPVGVADGGMMIPHKVLTMPSFASVKYTGTMMACSGIISVPSMMRKMRSRPRNTYLLSANAAMELMASVSTVAATVTVVLLMRSRTNGKLWTAFV